MGPFLCAPSPRDSYSLLCSPEADRGQDRGDRAQSTGEDQHGGRCCISPDAEAGTHHGVLASAPQFRAGFREKLEGVSSSTTKWLSLGHALLIRGLTVAQAGLIPELGFPLLPVQVWGTAQ